MRRILASTLLLASSVVYADRVVTPSLDRYDLGIVTERVMTWTLTWDEIRLDSKMILVADGSEPNALNAVIPYRNKIYRIALGLTRVARVELAGMRDRDGRIYDAAVNIYGTRIEGGRSIAVEHRIMVSDSRGNPLEDLVLRSANLAEDVDLSDAAAFQPQRIEPNRAQIVIDLQ